MNKFNLIVSTYRFREEEAQDEVLDLLQTFGDDEAESEITDIKGIIIAETTMDPVEVIAKLKALVVSDPWRLRYVLRVLPVDVVVPMDLESIREAVQTHCAKIGPEDTFRITVEKRHNTISSKDVIDIIADQIPNKVDLEKPAWIILVEILGAQTGISVIRPHEMFSSVIEKRK